jgi:hypothetical protein
MLRLEREKGKKRVTSDSKMALSPFLSACHYFLAISVKSDILVHKSLCKQRLPAYCGAM